MMSRTVAVVCHKRDESLVKFVKRRARWSAADVMVQRSVTFLKEFVNRC